MKTIQNCDNLGLIRSSSQNKLYKDYVSKSKKRLQSASATGYAKDNIPNSRSFGIMSEVKFHDNTY